MTDVPSRPADRVWLLHLSSSLPDAGTVARIHAAPAQHTLALTVVVAPDDEHIALVPAEKVPAGSLATVARRHVEQIAEMLLARLAEAPGPVVLAAVDRMTQLAAWQALNVHDDLIATNSLDSAIRVARLLERGETPDRVLHPPPFDVSLSVADAGLGPAASAVSTVTVSGRTPAVGEPWLALGDRDERGDLDVRTGSMSRRGAKAVASLAGTRRRVPATAERRLVIGPANYAGQGYEWARSVREHASGWTARNVHVAPASSRLAFQADLPLTAVQWADPATRVSLAVELLADSTDVLIEAMRPLLAVADASESVSAWDPRRGREDVEALRATGRRVALLFHGSEVRRPAHHLRLTPWSPFYRRENEDLTAQLEQVTERVHEAFMDFDGPILVSTPDLVDHVPNAVWLPGVVGPASFAPTRPALTESRPVVAHAPSNSALKGSECIDPVLRDLHRRKLIRYRRLHDLPSMMIPSMVAEVDVLVDQVVMGNPGVLAGQAMAAGRLVVAHLPEGVRRRMKPRSPIVEATPATLEDIMVSVVENREHYSRLAACGTEFARTHHDGRMSARVLTEAFGG
ncbi:hypothetical protein MLP_25700 [Microlunatus phosphovorus NM-1]|uniref:Uncharacterized protein n=1 Tax=Microlunatus phosphovorus (strain ATCC 700054 / DSM 10555 / JCM 9379 / NBRC 101784 / NCIMB 13414 / VKM Ac-1990 / NM-1) TaxID=1032480 RepID=F5XGV2_MICPN|nr:hypothetical protein [Microlunatus phosphovorus]BAK35584.1 hypothetical protein MLP_25700 [Microlunatus phosphovorus NM-1]